MLSRLKALYWARRNWRSTKYATVTAAAKYKTTGCDDVADPEFECAVNTVPLMSATVAPKQPALSGRLKERR